MNDQDKFVALIRLRDLLYFGVKPTLRQCGFTPDVVQELTKERLIQLGDKKSGDDLDRYIIDEILPAGISFILQQKALRPCTLAKSQFGAAENLIRPSLP